MIYYCTKAERATEKISDEEMEKFDCFISCDDCAYFIKICESVSENAEILNKQEKRLCPACGRLCEVKALDSPTDAEYIKCENCGIVGVYPRAGQI